MNILHIMWSLEFGGIERLVLDLCVAQRKIGHEVGVIVGRAKGRMKPQFEAENIPVFNAELRSGFDPGWLRGGIIKDELQRADIVHIHIFTPTLVSWAKKSGRAIVYTNHGNYGLGHRRNWRDKIKMVMRSRFIKHHVNYMTFNSQFTKDLTEQYFSLQQIPSKVIYNGINQDVPSVPEKKQLLELREDLDSFFVVGTTSRFVGFKRVDRLIEAFALVRNRDDCRLLLVGDGPLRHDYEKLAAELGISKLVIFTGYQPNARAYQGVMDVCVFPSSGEPFGLVAVETLALGKPTVVLQDGGGITEIIQPLEPEDVVNGIEGLAYRLENYLNLWEKGKLIDPVQMTARKERAQCFNVDGMAKAFDEVYLQCLERT